MDNQTTYYFQYRHEHKQTQYFIFDTNKSEDDPARMVNPGVAPEDEYSEWVDLKNNHTDDKNGNGFGVSGYSSIEEYKKYLSSTLGISMEQLDNILKPEELKKEEILLKNYLRAYESTYRQRNW